MALLKVPSGRWEVGPFDESDSKDFEARLHFEHKGRLEHLRQLAVDELWDRELKNLASYIRFTLVRVLQEGKVLGYFLDSEAHQGRRSPNTWCFNTGLISKALNQIFGVFFRVRCNKEVRVPSAFLAFRRSQRVCIPPNDFLPPFLPSQSIVSLPAAVLR